MIEIRTVTTLKTKRDEILQSIQLYERQIKQARADLAHINAAIKIFEASGEPSEMSRYVDTHRLYKQGEQIKLCKKALETGPKTTRELAIYVMQDKGLDVDDKVMAKAIAHRLIHALRMQCHRGKVQRIGKKGAAIIWKLPDDK